MLSDQFNNGVSFLLRQRGLADTLFIHAELDPINAVSVEYWHDVRAADPHARFVSRGCTRLRREIHREASHQLRGFFVRADTS
jgi:hypothetical protein